MAKAYVILKIMWNTLVDQDEMAKFAKIIWLLKYLNNVAVSRYNYFYDF